MFTQHTFESIQQIIFHSYSSLSSPSSKLIKLCLFKNDDLSSTSFSWCRWSCTIAPSLRIVVLQDDSFLRQRIPIGHESNMSGVRAVPRIRNSASVSYGISIDVKVCSSSNSYSIPTLCLSLSCLGPKSGYVIMSLLRSFSHKK